MSNLMIPGPGAVEPDPAGEEQARDAGGGNRGAGTGHCGQQTRSKKPPIPSPEDCARSMAQLIGLVTMGLLKPAQANTIRNALRDLLQYHQGKAKEAETGLANADVLDLLKKDPTVLSLLEPLLTEAQIEMIMKNANDVNGGT